MKCNLLAVLLALLVALPISAQESHVVTGKVVDNGGQPLVGAGIVARYGTEMQGTVADLNGNFSMTVPESATLEISFIGYVSQTVNVGTKTHFDIVLEEDRNLLEDVVVIGYGSQKKETLTGSVSVVGNDALISAPTTNLSNALVGRVPGISSLQSSGEPGDNFSLIRIRGVATFNSSGQNPLVVLDGVQTTIDVMNTIDPNEVQSISVLKDASATAVYGVQGANGVVVITTKRGHEGTPKVSFSYRYGITELATSLKMLDSYRYALLRNEAIMNDGDGSANQYLFSEEEIWKFYHNRDYTPAEVDAMAFLNAEQKEQLKNSKALYYRSEDWFAKQFGYTAPQQQFNVNIQGGSEAIKYFTSVGYNKQDGLFKNAVYGDVDNNSHYDRWNFRSNLDAKIAKRLDLSVNINGSIENNSGILGKDGDVSSASSRHKQMLVMILCSTPFRGADFIDNKLIGEYISSLNPLNAKGGGGFSPTAYLLQSSVLKTMTTNLGTTARLKHTMDYITEGLSASVAVSYNDYQRKSRTEYRTAPVYSVGRNPDNPNELLFFGGSVSPIAVEDNLNQYNSKSSTLYLEAKLEYNRVFNKHNIGGLILYNAQKYRSPGLEFNVPKGILGLAGRITYSYDNRYFAEFNAGYNGSENFPEGKRFGFFPAYSVGWIVTNEKFFPKNNILTFLKIRASYGEVGNDQIGGSRFLYLPNAWGYSEGKDYGAWFGYTDGSSVNPVYYKGATEIRLGNPDVTWERAKKTNIGIDANFFNDRLSIVADIFNEDRSDILWSYGTVPSYIGATPPYANLGRVKNHGYEISVSWDHTVGNFYYKIGGAVSYSVNKIIYQDEPENPYIWMNNTGFSYGQYKGFSTEGFYNTAEEAFNRPYVSIDNNRVQCGDIRYIDLNGDGLINDQDKAPIGYSNLPRYAFNGNIELGYKGFNIAALFTGSLMGSMPMRSFYVLNPFYMNSGSAMEFHYENRWTPEKAAAGEKISWPRASMRNYESQNGADNDLYLQSTDFLRLKNLEISYLFTGKWLKKAKISALKLYVSGSNLFTVCDMIPGYDPEQQDTGGAADGYLYPLTRSYNIGVNIQF